MMKKVFIIGSCVSRDAFGRDSNEKFTVETYVARSSLASAFADTAFANVVVANIKSAFQQRMVDIDINKKLPALLAETKADIILLDSIDERFDLYVAENGSIATLSGELYSSGFRTTTGKGEIINFGSDAFFERWEQGWQKLIDQLKRQGMLDRLRINRVYWSTHNQNGGDYQPEYPPQLVDKANKFLSRLYHRMEKDLTPDLFFDFPSDLLVGATNHQWGLSPFHYIPAYYQALLEKLRLAKATIQAEVYSNGAERLLVIADLRLTSTMQWFEVDLPTGETLVLDAEVEGSKGIDARRALVSFDYDNEDSNAALLNSGFIKSHDSKVGYFRYLSTRSGKALTTFKFVTPQGNARLRLGLRSWWAEGEVIVNRLTLTKMVDKGRKPKPSTVISVDVEALPGRATANHVDKLIYGDFGDGKLAGIPRLCEIFDSFATKATFFIEYAGTVLHGERKIFEAAEFLAGKGHDVQLHIHSEILVNERGWPYLTDGVPSFENLERPTAQACLEFGIEKFEKNLGYLPRIFRPGGMKHNRAMYDAVKHLGIEGVSALFRGFDKSIWPTIKEFPAFRWDNSVVELPLDLALDPLRCWEPFENEYKRIQFNRKIQPSGSLLIHSTSLLFRDPTNKLPCFTGSYEPYEEQLIAYLQQCAESGNEFKTYSDVLDNLDYLPQVKLDQLYPSLFTHPELGFRSERKRGNVRTTKFDEHIIPAYQPSPDNETLEAFVPPLAFPIKLAPGQRIGLVETGSTDQCIPSKLAYIVSGHKAYYLRQRSFFPGGELLKQTLKRTFEQLPSVELIIAETVLESEPVENASLRDVRRHTFVLSLPKEFSNYRKTFISKNLRQDIERSERHISRLLGELEFKLYIQDALDKETFVNAAKLVEERLIRKISNTNAPPPWDARDAINAWETYQRCGAVAAMVSQGKIVAAALCLFQGLDCFFMAAGHQDVSPSHSLGKLLLYRLIENLVSKGFQRIHLGGHDFGYKRRFGAVELPLAILHFNRPDQDSLNSRVTKALEAGQAVSVIEKDLKKSLEDILGEDFPSATGIKIPSKPILKDDNHNLSKIFCNGIAFRKLANSLPTPFGAAFSHIGCGTGLNIYHAAQIGFKRCIGFNASKDNFDIAKENLSKLQLQSEIKLLLGDPTNIDTNEISECDTYLISYPFTENQIGKICKTIVTSQIETPRPISVIYYNAIHLSPFLSNGFRIIESFQQGQADWQSLDSSVLHKPI